jgi:hypothetical protein
MGKQKEETVIKAGQGIMRDLISKTTNTKRAAGMAQVLELLPSKTTLQY